jgi:anti-anti-sigma factor
MSVADREEILSVEVGSHGENVAILRLTGEIDVSSAHLLTTQFKELAAEGPGYVVIDATRVTFMDSTGLHALVEGKRALHEIATRIYLVPSPQVRRVLELVFPDPLFAARLDSVEEALEGIDQTSAS